jgi:hypothetical protein
LRPDGDADSENGLHDPAQLGEGAEKQTMPRLPSLQAREAREQLVVLALQC